MIAPREQKRRDGRRTEARGTGRERLLDAAARIFAERGYRGASVDDVAAAAGVTKGALYWSFKSKEDLFFALLEERVDRRIRELMERLATADEAGAELPPVSWVLTQVVDEQRDVLLLTQEYWSLAVRNPKLRRRFVARRRALRDAVARAVAARQERTGGRPAVDPERLATAIVALASGLAMDRLADPRSVPEDLFGEVLALLYA